jgi:hypothetical protein
MTAAELHLAFENNASVANFNNEFHGVTPGSTSPYPVYKLWL